MVFSELENKPTKLESERTKLYVGSKDHREHQFMDRISKRDKLTIEDVNEVNDQASFVNLKTRWFKPFLLDVLSEKVANDRKYEEAISILENWNNLNEKIKTMMALMIHPAQQLWRPGGISPS